MSVTFSTDILTVETTLAWLGGGGKYSGVVGDHELRAGAANDREVGIIVGWCVLPQNIRSEHEGQILCAHLVDTFQCCNSKGGHSGRSLEAWPKYRHLQ